MSWAARRRFLILFGIGAIVVAFLIVVLVSTFYKTPTCSDGMQNQNEAGIDCGGSCPYLCTDQQQAPVVLFTQVIYAGDRVDVVSEIENKNAGAAAKNVTYTISLYDEKQTFLKKITGVIDLAPGATLPIYISDAYVEKERAVSAFLEIDSSSIEWYTLAKDSYIVPTISNIHKSGTINNPRIESTIKNPSFKELKDVQVIVFVYDASKNVIAASRTVIPSIQGQESSLAIFTWNNAFRGVPALLSVVPLPQLP